MSDKSLDAKLIANILRGLPALAEDVEGSMDLEDALQFPWSHHRRMPGRELSQYEPKLAPEVWRSMLETLAALHISKISTEYASLCAARCQSQVEELLLLGLIVVAKSKNANVGTPWPYGESVKGRCCPHPNRRKPMSTLMICPQHSIGEIHVDFMVTLADVNPAVNPSGTIEEVWSEESILIECDGHDFHERTKEQARRDKKRDRELQKLGFQVFRYTGSEVWGNPLGVASDVYETLAKRLFGRE